jgi:hypothetical protein
MTLLRRRGIIATRSAAPPPSGSLDTVGLVHNFDVMSLTASDLDRITVWPSDVGTNEANSPSIGPTYRTNRTPNGSPALVWNRDDRERMILAQDLEPVDGHMFVVGSITSSVSLQQIISRADSTNRQFRRNGSSLETAAAAPIGAQVGGLSENVFYVFELWATTTSAAAALSGTEGTVSTHSQSTFALNQIGCRRTSDEELGGDLCQIVAYDVVKTRTQADAIVDFLLDKWTL